MGLKAKKTLEIGALKMSELDSVQSFAEAILDSIATIKAGRDSVKGFLLRIDDDGNIEIVKEVKFSFEQRKTEEV